VRPEAEISKATRKLRMLRTLVCDDSYERAAQASGARRIAGIDEVGRGALFGPVVAAAVILPADCHAAMLQAEGLRDSKQLGPDDRERLAAIVCDCAAAVAIAEVDAATIDRINIYQATRLAMLRAMQSLTLAPDHLLIDAMRIDHPCAQTSVVYGDARSLSIAAASVVAMPACASCTASIPPTAWTNTKATARPPTSALCCATGPARCTGAAFGPCGSLRCHGMPTLIPAQPERSFAAVV
jgi:ribonuclease HII